MNADVARYARECAIQGLRGDYSKCRQDFTVDQDYGAYTAEDHKVWRQLVERQSAQAHRFGHESYLAGLRSIKIGSQIPDFDDVSGKLLKLTGWSIVPVPGLIPSESFFQHLAARRFPVTNWLRGASEIDYVVEPDLFHDFFGHVPILSQPAFADFMQLYGERALAAIDLGGNEMITRLYWYTAEYGLIESNGALKAFGAGLMSSGSELPFAMSEKAKTRPLDIVQIMRTGYEIDKFQRVYFVMPSFETLLEAFNTIDLPDLIAKYRDDPPVDPESL